MLERVGTLDEDNRTAWAIWSEVYTRFVVDHELMPMALESASARQGVSDQGELLSRLSIIYDVLVPPRPQEPG